MLTGAAASLPLFPSSASGSGLAGQSAAAPRSGSRMLTLDLSARPPAAQTAGFHMGTATAPGGQTLTLDSRSLLRDGRPWVFISGEFHFSRYPQPDWRDELLKMKAGAVSVVTAYVFWIHHEEIQGTWDWTGQRNLGEFLRTCQDLGLKVLLRIGPWGHGEVRNGGFPNWLQKMGDDNVFELRRDNPGYLGYVTRLYAQIALQSRGLLWKDGGPVIAIQLENEYSGPAQHLLTLKQIARDAAIDVPLYTCTGWGGGGKAPFGEMVPFSGGYVDGFWDRSLKAGGDAAVLRFSQAQHTDATAMGMMGDPATSNLARNSKAVRDTYPPCTCELGGGMMSSYHRRVLVYPQDTESLALVKLGSGVNLLGFYMYHGGQNPEGKLSYLNETQATNYWNDLPVKNYDFQAPIGEYGQQREHYHWLRLMGLFLHDFGPGISSMTSRTPNAGGSLNWAARSDGDSGYLFVSHYQHLAPQPDQENVQFRLKFAGGEITVPSAPVTVPYNTRFFWPLNLNLGGINLISATAQPICQITDRSTRYTVFKQTAVVPAEFVFDGAATTIDSCLGNITRQDTRIHLGNVQPGLGAAIRLHAADGKMHVIILLDEATSLNLWKAEWHGQERLFLTHANLLFDGPALRLRTDGGEGPEGFSVAIFPAPANLTDGNSAVPANDDGLFRRFSPRVAPQPRLQAIVQQIKPAGPPRTIPIAPSVPTRKQGMAMQPEDADFAQAAVWHVNVPAGVAPGRNLRLRVRYTGDVLRAYLGDKLIDDDFYSARPFEIGLGRYGPAIYQDGLTLKILPLREDAPIYITDRSQLKFDATHTALALEEIEVIETHEVALMLAG